MFGTDIFCKTKSSVSVVRVQQSEHGVTRSPSRVIKGIDFNLKCSRCCGVRSPSKSAHIIEDTLIAGSYDHRLPVSDFTQLSVRGKACALLPLCNIEGCLVKILERALPRISSQYTGRFFWDPVLLM